MERLEFGRLAIAARGTSVGPLGIAIVAQLEKAHAPLAELDNKRVAAEATLRELVDRATLDVLHDRKARSLYHHLQGFIEGADDPKLVAEYRAMEALLFPIGLRVVQLPYIEEGGAAVALDRAVGPDQRAKLASIKVGEQTMASLFKAWIQAGHAVGAAVGAGTRTPGNNGTSAQNSAHHRPPDPEHALTSVWSTWA